MPKYRDLATLDILQASWTDVLQEMLSSVATRMVVTHPAVGQLRFNAAAAADQLSVSVNGLYRWITADITITHPAGNAGTVHTIWAVASANVFGGPGDVDTTDYSFGIQITTGANPTGNHNGRAITAFKKIGETDWDGTNITGLRLFVGQSDNIQSVHQRGDRSVPAGVFQAGANQTADIVRVQNAAGSSLAVFTSAGDLVFGTGGRVIRGLDGASGNPGVAGAPISVLAGNGGAGAASGNSGGAGGALTLAGGTAGVASGAGVNGAGGGVDIIGRTGGATGSNVGGAGGSITVTAGNAGSLGNAQGGAVVITSGRSAGSTRSGDVTLTTGSPLSGTGGAGHLNLFTGSGGAAGNINITAGVNNANGAGGTGGGAIFIVGGNADPASGALISGGTVQINGGASTGGGTGGPVDIISGVPQTNNAGSSGNVSIRTGNTPTVTSGPAGAPGTVAITGGNGGGSASGVGPKGGSITLTAGNGGAGGAATAGAGGDITLVAGNPSSTGTATPTPGAINITGGFQPFASIGGAVTVTGGSGRPGGSVTIVGGPADNITAAVGGQVIIGGGAGPSGNPGDGGAVTVRGGDPISGVGGALTLRGGAGAGGTNNGGDVSITGGSTTGGTRGKVKLANNAADILSFFAVAGSARTAAYTLNAGGTSRNLAAAGAVLNVEQVLRQVITDLIAYGILQ